MLIYDVELRCTVIYLVFDGFLVHAMFNVAKLSLKSLRLLKKNKAINYILSVV